MEAVPDVCHHTAAEAYVHDRKSDAVCDSFSQTDLLAKEEQRDQHRDENAAVYVGHTVTDVRVRRDEEAADEIEKIIRDRELFRESAAGRGRLLKRDISRQRKECRQAARDQGIRAKAPDRGPEILKCDLFRDGHIKDRRVENQEQAYEIAGVEIGDQTDRKREAVKKRLLLFHELDQTEHDQRKEHYGIVPHDVPEIGDRPTAEGVERRKRGQKKIFSVLIEFRKKEGHEKTGKTAADNRQ